ncbi:hypothetical protein ACET3Z_026623 [Daucus carota]
MVLFKVSSEAGRCFEVKKQQMIKWQHLPVDCGWFPVQAVITCGDTLRSWEDSFIVKSAVLSCGLSVLTSTVSSCGGDLLH